MDQAGSSSSSAIPANPSLSRGGSIAFPTNMVSAAGSNAAMFPVLERPMTAVSPLGMPVGNAMGIAGTLGRNAGLPPRPGTAAVPSVSSILGGL